MRGVIEREIDDTLYRGNRGVVSRLRRGKPAFAEASAVAL